MNPQLATAMQNPAIRSMMSNPEFLRQMTSPAAMQVSVLTIYLSMLVVPLRVLQCDSRCVVGDCFAQAMSQMPGLGQGGMGANPMMMDPNMMMMMNNPFMNPYGGGGGGFGGPQGGLDFSSLMGGRNPNPSATAQPPVPSLNEPPPETR